MTHEQAWVVIAWDLPSVGPTELRHTRALASRCNIAVGCSGVKTAQCEKNTGMYNYNRRNESASAYTYMFCLYF